MKVDNSLLLYIFFSCCILVYYFRGGQGSNLEKKSEIDFSIILSIKLFRITNEYDDLKYN